MPACAPNADGPPRGGMPWRRQLAVVFLTLAAATRLQADVVRILDDNREAAQARVDLIQLAQREINVDYFSVADDDLAHAFLALLRDAARRGVTVRLLVDGLNNHIPDEIQSHLLAAGVQIREYHPVKCTHPLWLNRRLHDKVFVVDCRQAIVGSRNLDGRNFGLACRNFVDRDAYVCGCAAEASHRHFHRLWASDDVRPVDPGGAIGRCLKLGDDECPNCTLNRSLNKLITCGFIRLDAVEIESGADAPSATVHFLYDDGGPKEEPGDISTKLLELLDYAEQSIVLESPYLVFSEHLKQALTRAQARGVEVIILTNSLASTDQPLVYAQYENQKRMMMRRGVEFWEFVGPSHLHAKSILVDGYISVIGSYNFDPRSEHLNTETAIISCDQGLAEALIESMANHFAQSWQIGPDGHPLGADSRHPGVGVFDLQKHLAARLIAPLIKRHL
jgi:phosphatidylserine/phosphatidylglycerophosphate/cardiolipin synthase-like enzyme